MTHLILQRLKKIITIHILNFEINLLFRSILWSSRKDGHI